MQSSLSEYFPSGTSYFYGYPTSLQSGFLNLASPLSEELVAARPLVCAGAHVNVVSFANPVRADLLRILRDEVGLPVVDGNRIITLPNSIDETVVGEERDRRVQAYLAEVLSDRSFVMAQPYTGPLLHDKYRIDPSVTTYLNDKASLEDIVPEEYQAKIYQRLENGAELSRLSSASVEIPCVVKVNNSSAGDGVRVCQTPEDFEVAQRDFAQVDSDIVLQEYLGGAEDIDIQFGVPHDSQKESKILGFTRQMTTPKGEYLAGIFDDRTEDNAVRNVFAVVQKDILPKARALGWEGVGGVDVMVRPNGTFAVIDGNWRMTATLAYRMQEASGCIQTPFVTFSGKVSKGLDGFVRGLVPLARVSSGDRVFHPINLSEHNGVVRFNAALLYDGVQTLQENAQLLKTKGVESEVLDEILRKS